jgi:aryl-alcohol dehydrogenase-like predicted oxidoreductase
MEYRAFGRTGWNISAIGFGAWALGGSWGEQDDTQSLAALEQAVENGLNFIDTADVYGDGHSEQLIAKFLKGRREQVYVATKLGRRLNPHIAEGYNRANMEAFIDRSLQNLQTDRLDIVQLHCPPLSVYRDTAVFAALDDFVKDGKIRYYGVSVETVEEAMTAIENPNVQSVQIIFNMFRLKPAEKFFQIAKEKQIGILARVPLASGMLSGKMRADTVFAADDHRQFNRHGEAFDIGETFSGVPYDVALQAVERLRPLVPEGATLVQLALRWILMFPEVTTAIPGARNVRQATENIAAASLPSLSAETMQAVQSIYDDLIRAHIHHRW